MIDFSLLDIVALGWFLVAWGGYAYLNDRSWKGADGLTRTMDQHRRQWMREAARREVRIVDTQILGSLQNGTAFFASTSLIALGGSFTLLNQADRMVRLFNDLPIGGAASASAIEAKVLILCAIYGYAFFQFGWAYRLFNYTAIMLGAVPSVHRATTPELVLEAEAAADRASAMQLVAGRHFNWGLRGLFFSIGYLGWFVNGWTFLATTTFILAVLLRRQYASSALNAARTP